MILSVSRARTTSSAAGTPDRITSSTRLSLWWWGFAGVRGRQEGLNRVASILLVGVLHKTCRAAVPAGAAGRLRESRSERLLSSLSWEGSLGSR